MIIKIILSFGLFLVFAFALTQRSSARLVSRLLFLISLSGTYFVWFPEQTGAIARFVGVGRGVDLIFYVLFVLGVIAVFSVYLRVKDLYALVTSLARRMALADPLSPGGARAGTDSLADGAD